MGCGCKKTYTCDTVKSTPAILVYDKNYEPFEDDDRKFKKYQNFINKDL